MIIRADKIRQVEIGQAEFSALARSLARLESYCMFSPPGSFAIPEIVEFMCESKTIIALVSEKNGNYYTCDEVRSLHDQ